MSNEDFKRIKTAIGVMANTFGRRMDGETLLYWATRLESLAGPKMWAAFASAMDGDEMPTLKHLVSQSSERVNSFKQYEPLSAPDKKRADHTAILCMLWLHYEKGWRLEDFAGTVMGRLFGGDPRESLEKAKSVYTREEVAILMADRLSQADREDRERLARSVPA